jgi:hypothetical protein
VNVERNNSLFIGSTHAYVSQRFEDSVPEATVNQN